MSSEGDANNSSQGSNSTAGDSPPSPPAQGLDWPRFMEVVHTRKVDVALWATRLLTVVFSTFYMIPIMGLV